ncbi:hypothetical protein [Kovacikia minuta]|nr:hypothetical protein [Kovacikia minuta]
MANQIQSLRLERSHFRKNTLLNISAVGLNIGCNAASLAGEEEV